MKEKKEALIESKDVTKKMASRLVGARAKSGDGG